jgi:2-polyprenyl-3-methyl-5-hydroxy-6-metoxy-1,4-benzoquinol methylase
VDVVVHQIGVEEMVKMEVLVAVVVMEQVLLLVVQETHQAHLQVKEIMVVMVFNLDLMEEAEAEELQQLVYQEQQLAEEMAVLVH